MHKEQELHDIYELVNDKLRILSAAKNVWEPRVTTAFSQQGHNAQVSNVRSLYPAADGTLERISDLSQYDLDGRFLAQPVASSGLRLSRRSSISADGRCCRSGTNWTALLPLPLCSLRQTLTPRHND